MALTYIPNVPAQWLVSGAAAASYQLFTYEAGTTTKLGTFTDSAGTTANTNPIVLDADGRATIFLQAKSYKFVLAPPTDTDPPTNPTWTRDNIQAIPETEVDLDVTGTAGEAIAANDCCYLSDGSGSLTAGRWYKVDADNTYSSSEANAIGFAPSAIASGAEGTIRRAGKVTGLSGLTAGSIYYVSATAGAITSSAPTNKRAVGQAENTTTLVIFESSVPNIWTNLPEASTSAEGIVNLGDQVLGQGQKTIGDEVPLFIPGTTTPTGITARVSGWIDTQLSTTGFNNAANTDEQDLVTYTLPANTWDTNGTGLRFTIRGAFDGTVANKTLKFYVGSDGNINTGAIATTSVNWIWLIDVYRVGAASQLSQATLWLATAAGGSSAVFVDGNLPTEDETAGIIFKITGQSSVATADIIKVFSWRAEVI